MANETAVETVVVFLPDEYAADHTWQRVLTVLLPRLAAIERNWDIEYVPMRAQLLVFGEFEIPHPSVAAYTAVHQDGCVAIVGAYLRDMGIKPTGVLYRTDIDKSLMPCRRNAPPGIPPEIRDALCPDEKIAAGRILEALSPYTLDGVREILAVLGTWRPSLFEKVATLICRSWNSEWTKVLVAGLSSTGKAAS